MTTIIQLFYDIVIPDSNKTKNILSIIILVFISLSFAMKVLFFLISIISTKGLLESRSSKEAIFLLITTLKIPGYFAFYEF